MASEDDDDMHNHRHTTPPRSATPTTMNTVNLCVGVPFMYQIPSFSEIHITLRQILFNEHDLPTKYDGFIQDSTSLSRSLSHTIEITNWSFIPVSYYIILYCKLICILLATIIIFIQVDELCKVVTVRYLNFSSTEVFVVWKWNWFSLFETPPPAAVTTLAHDQSISAPNHCDTNIVMHTVRFKCIGSNKDPKYQSALAAAADMI